MKNFSIATMLINLDSLTLINVRDQVNGARSLSAPIDRKGAAPAYIIFNLVLEGIILDDERISLSHPTADLY